MALIEEKQKLRHVGLDILVTSRKTRVFSDIFHFQLISQKKNSSVLLGRKGIVRDFYTEESGRYLISGKSKISLALSRVDGISSRDVKENKIYFISPSDILFLRIRRRYSRTRNYIDDLVRGTTEGVSMAKMWNLSIVGAVIFGMFTMTIIYRYLGQNVSAKMQDSTKNSELVQNSEKLAKASEENINDQIDTEYITRILTDEDNGEKMKNKDFEKEIREMVEGYPIEKMVPEIVKQDRVVAAFLVAIAKKESNWGKRVPVLDGQDCYNYWGYRGIRDKMGTGGHTCFDSPKDAVDTVAQRIEYLVSETKRDTASKMVVWKCGYDCSWDNRTAVKKWISDVNLYFQKLNDNGKED